MAKQIVEQLENLEKLLRQNCQLIDCEAKKQIDLEIESIKTTITNQANTINTAQTGNFLFNELLLLCSKQLTVDETLKSCLKLVSEYTKWPLGRAMVLYRTRIDLNPNHSLYYCENIEIFDYSTFIANVGIFDYNNSHINVLECKKPTIVYLNSIKYKENIYQTALNAGFENLIILPVILNNQVGVLVEFFTKEIIENSIETIEFLNNVSSHISYVLERKSLEEEYDKFLMAIEQNQTSVIITNAEGFIEYVNPYFCEISGYSNDEVLGKKPGILKSGNHGSDFYSNLWDTISLGKIWHGEICNRHKNGELFWEQVNISPIKDKAGKINHYVAVKIDITEKKKWEANFIKAKEEAESANRSKSEFLAAMSHEIRTPMNAILGFAELLATKITDELLHSYIESIRSSGKTLLNLINDVLDLSKIEAGKMALNLELFDPFHLFKDIEYMFVHKAIDKGLEFKVEVDLSLPVGIESDEVRLRQIMINLIGNAIKFTHHGFVIVTVKSKPNTSIEPDGFIDLEIEVTDSGIGISEQFRDKMFSPFTQQEGQDSKRYGGTGLGLSITRRMVDLLNGKIEVFSREGKGSIFSVNLFNIRTSRVMQKSSNLLTITPSRIKFKPAVIIIADDVENNRKYFKGVINNTDVVVIETENGLDTIRQAQLCRPNAIITDIKMPGIDGFEILSRIKSDPLTCHIPVIATTASASIEDKNQLLKHPFDGILIKPIQVNDVYLELMRLLPHEILDNDSTIDENTQIYNSNGDIAINAVSDEHIFTVKRILETDLYTTWKSFNDQQPLAEVEAFAQNCCALGEKYQMEILVSYGNRLLLAINNFDVDSMLKTLGDYPKLLNTFKSVNID